MIVFIAACVFVGAAASTVRCVVAVIEHLRREDRFGALNAHGNVIAPGVRFKAAR